MAQHDPDPDDAKRDEVIAVALELIALTGYSASTTSELAAAAGLPEAQLIDLFGSREALFAEVIRRRDELDAGQFVGELGPTVADFGRTIGRLVRQNSRVPGLVQLFSSVIAESTPADHPSHGFVVDRYRQADTMVTDALERIVADGYADRDMPSPMIAVLLTALIDGLQTQWLYDRRLDMGAHIELFCRLVDNSYRVTPDAGPRANPDDAPEAPSETGRTAEVSES